LIAWIGVFSYSIYLWQADLGSIPTRHWIMPHLPQKPVSVYWALSMSFYLVATIATGIIMSKLIEMPVLALRDRFFPGRIPVPTRPAPTENADVAAAAVN
jgi:peptidoglycan/LPS O-acetylase OafA/YrhL